MHEELSKIKNKERLSSVVVFLSGLLSKNVQLEFLNTCKHLCKTFLNFVQNSDRERCAQEVFKSLMTVSFTEDAKMLDFKIKTKDGNFPMRNKDMNLLLDAMSASEEKISEDIEISLPVIENSMWTQVGPLINLFKKQPVKQLTIEEVWCDKLVPDPEMMTLLSLASSWEIGQVKRGGMSKIMVLNMKGEKLDSIHADSVVCSSDGHVSLLCSILESMNYMMKGWSIETLEATSGLTRASWDELADLISNGKVVRVTASREALHNAQEEALRKIWGTIERDWQIGDSRKRSAKKTDGNDGFARLLAMKMGETSKCNWLCCS